MKRFLDILLSFVAAVVMAVPILLIAILVKLTSRGPVLYWSSRVGVDNKTFLMPKFRTMRLDTPQVATHLLTEPGLYLTPIGRLLRRSSLDELPQLYSVLKGDLSLVGPRPALFNQTDLIELRTRNGVYRLVPGLTGWAQVNGRDDLPIPVKVQHDLHYLEHRSSLFDIKIIFLTFLKVVQADGVSH